MTATIDAATAAEVERSIREVAQAEVLPRFGHLQRSDIHEKAPGDRVTVADRSAEEALAARLRAVIPGSVVVGEESTSADPTVLDRLAGSEPVWIIDPIDGTENFISGSSRFSTLVALAVGGRLLASWTHAPVLGMTATAFAGQGAYVDGERVHVGTAPATLRNLDVMTSQPRWWPPAIRPQILRLGAQGVALSFFDTSGLAYVELAAGRRSVTLMTWELVWDHAAGLLLHQEAGGVARTLDGDEFRLTGGNALPLVVAPDEASAARVIAALVGSRP